MSKTFNKGNFSAENMEGGNEQISGIGDPAPPDLARTARRAVRGFSASILLSSFSISHVMAQGTNVDDHKEPDLPAIPATKAYSFQMRLKSDVDVSVQIKGKAGEKNPASGSRPSAPHVMTIQRSIRKDIVCVRQQSGDTVMCDRYYLAGLCAFDDPRMGINARRTSFIGMFEPLDSYNFPELLWAVPKTRRDDPNAALGAKKIEIYQEGGLLLEVDAVTHRPLRFRNGTSEEWTYSYVESSTPIVLPPSLEKALRHVLGKRGT